MLRSSICTVGLSLVYLTCFPFSLDSGTLALAEAPSEHPSVAEKTIADAPARLEVKLLDPKPQNKDEKANPKKNGEKGYLGIQIKNDPGGQGITVVDVLPKTPAFKADIKIADIIAKIDNMPVGTVTTFVQTIGEHKPGDKVNLWVLRDGKQKKLSVTLAGVQLLLG